MSQIKTSKGLLRYKQHLLYFGNHKINRDIVTENLHLFATILDKIGINWGPAFGTLIGIVRNDDLLPWNPVFDVYFLKEDEERFKDALWLLCEVGFSLVRYERRGLYYLSRKGEFFKIFVLHKISSDVRHTGGEDFIHETYLQNLVKWNFMGVDLNVPAKVDEYLEFRYGNWYQPEQTKEYKESKVKQYYHWAKYWI